MREQFNKLGTAIDYYQVEWEADQLKYHAVFKGWKGLSLAAELNTENYEALAKRANWLGMLLESDSFSRAMLAAGVPLTTIKVCDDPDVPYQGKACLGLIVPPSMHDSVCDVAVRRFTQTACLLEVCAKGVVCIMRAFVMVGGLGPSSLCPTGVLTIARCHSSLFGLWLGSGGGVGF